jgi:hypothetical protein
LFGNTQELVVRAGRLLLPIHKNQHQMSRFRSIAGLLVVLILGLL